MLDSKLQQLTSLSQADAQGRATYLVSSNILNFEFYNSHGFETVGEVYLGDDNPGWHQEPITVQLVSSIIGRTVDTYSKLHAM